MASISLRVGLLAVAVALAIGFARPQDASAHAVLERSSPVQNEKLDGAPELVETWYSEPLEKSLTTLEVLDTLGNPVHTGETIFSDDPVYAAIALPPDLEPGIYTVTFQNVSTVDGHTWSGFFTFIVLLPDGSVPEGEALVPTDLGGQTGYLPDVSDTILHWLGLIAATTLAGGLFFSLLVARPAARVLGDESRRAVEDASTGALAWTVVASSAGLLVSNVGQLLILADRLGGMGEINSILFDTRSGDLWLSRIGLTIAFALLFAPATFNPAYRSGRHVGALVTLATIGALGLLITYSLGSHGAAAVGGAFWAVAADFVHFVATAAWLGTLLQVALLFRWTQRRLTNDERLIYRATALDRFSWVAVVGVFLLIGTGVFNGFVQLPRLPALWDTTYGRVLIAKLALIIPLLVLAGLNAVYLKPKLVEAIDALGARAGGQRPAGQHRPRIEERMRRLQRALPVTIAAEFAVGIAVLVSVSILVQSTTADGELRAEANQPEGRFEAAATADDLNVELLIEPFGLGLSTFSVTLAPQPGGAPVDAVAGVRLNAVFDDPNLPPSAGTTGTDLELEQSADDPAVWSSEAALLTQPGDWRIKTFVRRSGADVFDAESEYVQVSGVASYLAREDVPSGLFDLPFTYVDWNVVAGGAMVTLGLGAVLIWRQRPPSWRRRVSAPLAFSGVIAMMAGTVLLFGVHTHEAGFQRNIPERIVSDPQSLTMGEQIFMNNCVTCHGREGRGDGPGSAGLRVPPADLTLHVPKHNDGTLFLWVSEGLPLEGDKVMPSFKDVLTEDERWHVANYLREVFGSGRYEPLDESATPAPTSTE